MDSWINALPPLKSLPYRHISENPTVCPIIGSTDFLWSGPVACKPQHPPQQNMVLPKIIMVGLKFFINSKLQQD